MFEVQKLYLMYIQLALNGNENTKCSHCMCQCMSVLFDVKKTKKGINSENENELKYHSAVYSFFLQDNLSYVTEYGFN